MTIQALAGCPQKPAQRSAVFGDPAPHRVTPEAGRAERVGPGLASRGEATESHKCPSHVVIGETPARSAGMLAEPRIPECSR